MAIDQQPYLQGALSVALLRSFIQFGNDLPTRPVGTGPGIIDASNVDVVIDEFKVDDIYLMCSDGLNDMLEDVGFRWRGLVYASSFAIG